MYTRGSAILSRYINRIITDQGSTLGSFFKPTFSETIEKLFKNGEQGFFYDPNDLSTMFQDAAGTVPVTAVGQPVGLILDKSKELALGTERAVNGNFDDLSAWINYSNPTKSVQNGILRLEVIQSISGIYQDIPLPNHSTCKVVVRARKVSGASLARIFIVPRTTDFNAPNTTADIIGDSFKDYVFHISKEANAAGIRVYFQLFPSDAVIEVDSVSVKGIAGNHAYQTTSASRPILRQNAITGAYYLEFDGSDDFLRTANIDFTATDKVSLFAGVRKLSDAQAGTVVESGTNYTIPRGGFVLNAPLGVASYGAGISGAAGSVTTRDILGYAAPNSAILSLKIDLSKEISTDQLKVRINATDKTYSSGTSAKGGNFANTPVYIGRRSGTLYPFNGHIYGLIGVGKLASDTEIAAIEKELAKRVGVTLNV